MALEISLRKSNLGQKSILFIGPSVWNKLSNDLKILDTVACFAHNYKKLLIKKLEYNITSIITSITNIITKTFIINIVATITVITF